MSRSACPQQGNASFSSEQGHAKLIFVNLKLVIRWEAGNFASGADELTAQTILCGKNPYSNGSERREWLRQPVRGKSSTYRTSR